MFDQSTGPCQPTSAAAQPTGRRTEDLEPLNRVEPVVSSASTSWTAVRPQGASTPTRGALCPDSAMPASTGAAQRGRRAQGCASAPARPDDRSGRDVGRTTAGQGHSLYSGGFGSTVRPKVDALTPARHAYQATAAVMRPR